MPRRNRRVNLNGSKQGHAVLGTSSKYESKIGAVAATARACSRRTGGGRNFFMFPPMSPSQSQDDENEPEQEEAKEPESEPELDLNYVDKAASDRIIDYPDNIIALVNFDNLIGEIIKSVVSTIDMTDNRAMAQELENNWYISIDDTLYTPSSYQPYNDGTSTYIYLSTSPEYTPGEEGENDYEIKFYTTRNLTDESAPAPEPEEPEPDPETEPSLPKILLLHGGGGSQSELEAQQGIIDLRESLDNKYEFVFLSATEDGTAGTWWDEPESKDQPTTSEDHAMDTINKINQEIEAYGPYYAILGYSQGAAAAIVWDAFNRSRTNPFVINKLLLFNGYLPTTHSGLMTVIDENSPSDTDTLIFLGELDTDFYPLGFDIKAKFSAYTEIIDSGVGHALPTSADNKYSDVLAFINA
jgi:predicted esterase